MQAYSIHPSDFKALGATHQTPLILFCSESLKDKFTLKKVLPEDSIIFVKNDFDLRIEIAQLPEPCHVVTILPDSLVHSLTKEQLGKRKLLIMACRSGKTSADGIQHFLTCLKDHDIDAEQAKIDDFFAVGESAQHLVIKDKISGSQCRFDHMHDDYEWHEQSGYLDWGDQQVLPSGEVACFLVPLYTDSLPERQFDLNGSLFMSGMTVVQSGTPSFRLEDQTRIHQQLSTSGTAGVVLEIQKGNIVGMQASGPEAQAAANMLEQLITVDSRFGRIYEVGFSMNAAVRPWPGNTAMNEVWGQDGGKLHLGLGMLPYSQYHIDVFCQHSYVETADGAHLFGKKPSGMKRRQSAFCPCTETL